MLRSSKEIWNLKSFLKIYTRNVKIAISSHSPEYKARHIKEDFRRALFSDRPTIPGRRAKFFILLCTCLGIFAGFYLGQRQYIAWFL